MFKNMFKKTYTMIDTHRKAKSEEEPNIPEGLWRKCNKCGQPIYVEDVRNNLYVCPKCGGEMYQRDDDNEATVRNRLDVYEKSTAPLIDYYRGCDLLVSIDGDRDPNVVYADVKQALGL